MGDALEANVAAGSVGIPAARFQLAGDWASAVAIIAACISLPSVIASLLNIWLPSDLHAVYQFASETAALVVGALLARSVMRASEPRRPQLAVALLVAALGIGASAFLGPSSYGYQIHSMPLLSSALNWTLTLLAVAGLIGVPAALVGCAVVVSRSYRSTRLRKVGAILVVVGLASVLAYFFYTVNLSDNLHGDINGFESELIWAEGLEAAEAPAGAAVIAAAGLMGVRKRTRAVIGRSA